MNCTTEVILPQDHKAGLLSLNPLPLHIHQSLVTGNPQESKEAEVSSTPQAPSGKKSSRRQYRVSPEQPVLLVGGGGTLPSNGIWMWC